MVALLVVISAVIDRSQTRETTTARAPTIEKKVEDDLERIKTGILMYSFACQDKNVVFQNLDSIREDLNYSA